MADPTHYIRVKNGVVMDVWDYPPKDMYGWLPAIEIKPDIDFYHQCYGSHYIDISKSPAEIVWPVKDLTLEERKYDLRCKLQDIKTQVTSGQLGLELHPDADKMFDFAYTDQVFIGIDTQLKALVAANSHTELDVILAWWQTKFAEINSLNLPSSPISV